jgi:protein O-GlcNAc transferase
MQQMSDPTTLIAEASRALAAGDIRAARTLLDRLAAQHPANLDVLQQHIVCAGTMGDFAAARASAESAVRIAPDRAIFWTFLAQAQLSLRDYASAEVAARRALALEPTNVDTMRGLAWLLHHCNRFREAADVAKLALQRASGDADLWLKYAIALQCLGRVDQAADVYAQGAAACPASVELAEGRAACSNYTARFTPSQRRALHDCFGELVSREAIGCRAPMVDRAAGRSRPIRLAFISSDLRTHSVAYFVTPLLRYVDPKRFELHVFHAADVEDDATRALRSLLPAQRWRFLPYGTTSPRQLETAIRAAAIDVCIELNGLTEHHSLRALARRPAPLQCSYLGYPNTTGMPAIDCRIADSLTDPDSAAEAGCSEKLLRLDPCFVCYTPTQDILDLRPEPRRADAVGITFGSCNMITKVNDFVLALWCQLLVRVPNSRLLIKSRGLETNSVLSDMRLRVASATQAADIEASRIELQGWMPGRSAHLAAYHSMDIALDTFPYNGTTTTLEALLMGVPVLSLAGETHASRVGLSLLTAAGLPELCASTEADFVDRAVALAYDRDRLQSLRTSIRGRVLSSPLCDGPRFAKRFYSILEREWALRYGR